MINKTEVMKIIYSFCAAQGSGAAGLTGAVILLLVPVMVGLHTLNLKLCWGINLTDANH